jgi:hypothetical protein
VRKNNNRQCLLDSVSSQGFVSVDKILDDLVERMTHMEIPIRIGWSIVQDEDWSGVVVPLFDTKISDGIAVEHKDIKNLPATYIVRLKFVLSISSPP